MATIIIPNFLTEKVVNGLNTYQYTIQTAGVHVAKIRTAHPSSSGMTITISQNGTPRATTTATDVLTPGGQTSSYLATSINCAVNDVITWTISSSNVNDQQLNTVKSTLNLHMGYGN